MAKSRTDEAIAEAIVRCFESSNEADSNMEAANIVDVLAKASRSIWRLHKAITPEAQSGQDAAGGSVYSLTEAVMGITAGLCKIAEAIDHLAQAVQEMKE